MSTPEQQIAADMRDAMKAGDREGTSTLRMLLNEIKNERIRQREEVDEAGLVRVLRRGIKQRTDSATQYESGGREELAAKERREIEILAAYLPEEVGDDELRGAIAEIMQTEGLAGPGGMGPLMKQMMARFSDRADGSRISRLVREALDG